MTYRKPSSVALVLLAFTTLGLGGCLGVGGCGDPATSALMKIGTGQMTQLTADELQALAEMVSAQQGLAAPEIPDALAQAGIDILQANGINTIDQLLAFLQNLQRDPTSVTIPASAVEALPSLIELFNSFHAANTAPST